jgi:hypothetical protein
MPVGGVPERLAFARLLAVTAPQPSPEGHRHASRLPPKARAGRFRRWGWETVHRLYKVRKRLDPQVLPLWSVRQARPPGRSSDFGTPLAQCFLRR